MIDVYLTESITIRYCSLDQWNVPTWTDATVKARVEWANRLIRNAQGEQVVSAGKVFLSGSIARVPVTADCISISGVDHAIMRVDQKAAFSTSHYEVYIQ